LDNDLVEKTKRTAELYFKDVKGERPFDLWRAFDKGLAKDLSLFITGSMYAREKISHPTRQLVTIAALTVLSRPEELALHIEAALNVGCTPGEIAETIFQTLVYGGVPAANTALKVLRDVLQEKGMWPIEEK
jgi:4-carboxymuconolactone decarboxylase